MTDEELVEELQELAEAKDRASALEFAESLGTYLEANGSLTEGQKEKAHEILEELS